MHQGTTASHGRRQRLRLRRAGVPAAVLIAATVLAAGRGAPVSSSLVADSSPVGGGGHLYWSNRNWIGRAGLDGTGVDQRFIKLTGLAAMVAVSSGYLYWATDRGPGVPPAGSGAIGRANLNGSAVNQRFIAVPNGPKGVAGLAVNSRYIYWTDERGGEIGRASLNGTGVNQRFITGAHTPTALAAGSGYLYWTNWGSDAIGRARRGGTGVSQRLIAIPGGSPNGVAVAPG
jgi:hypothetical protein